jgi:hypothetical protein
MPVHTFSTEHQVQVPSAIPSSLPHGLPELPAVRQLSHAEPDTRIAGVKGLDYPYNLEEFLQPGFQALDGAMKQYFSGIRVPTKDSYRFMRVKIAGGDRSLLIWADEMREGKAKLPVAAISRESEEFNPEKYSPAYHAMTMRYLSTRGDKVAKVFRPVPYLVQYKLTIWAESKRDAEHIKYQVLTRFNPLAEFRMYDGHLEGNVQLRLSGSTDASDKEAGYDQNANVRYELNCMAEAWLPLPEKVIPTVLGRTTVLKEMAGEILWSIR